MGIAILVLTAIEFAMTFFLKPSMHRSKNNVDIVGFWNCMMRFSVIRRLFSVEVLRGFAINGALGVVIIMYTIYMFQTDLNLGIFTTVFSAIAIATAFLFGRFARKSMFPKILFISTIVAMFGLGAFVTHTSPLTFILFQFINVTAIWALGMISDVNMFSLAQSKCIKGDHKTEYFLFRETALGIGRWAAFISLVAIGVFGGYEWLRWYLVALIAVIVLTGFMAVRLSMIMRK
jgi:hypothetical protein